MREMLRTLLDSQPASGTLFLLVLFGYACGIGVFFIAAALVYLAIGIIRVSVDDVAAAIALPFVALPILALQGAMIGALVVAGVWILRRIAARTIGQSHWL